MRPLDGATYTVKSLRKQNYGENQKNKQENKTQYFFMK